MIRQQINHNYSSRSKGIMHAAGKIYKGLIKNALKKHIVSSIPTQFQNIIYYHSAEKGFNTSQQRFKKDIPNFMQLPQSIANKQSHYKSIRDGYGSFKSKTPKFQARKNKYPGPGEYNHSQFCCKQTRKKIKIRQCSNKNYITQQSGSNKRRSLQNQKLLQPGPGYYQKQNLIQWKDNNLKGCKSSFLTKEGRNKYIGYNDNPGPGFYNLQNFNEKMPLSRKVQRKIQKNQQRQAKTSLKKRSMILNEKPGPGSYNSEIPTFKPFYDTMKVSKNFISGRKTRFGDDQAQYRFPQYQQDEKPSPFSYKIGSSFDKFSETKLIQSSYFMSQSKRQVFMPKKINQEDYYKANQDMKKNFHFNIKQKWL